MSAPADVRAVLEDLARVLYVRAESDDDNRLAEQALQARAAVAELIDKAENAARILHNVIGARQIGAGYQTNLDDLNAALARVQGGA